MSNRSAKDPDTSEVECITPILRVSRLPISLRYYVEVLGFGVDWGHEDDSEMASVSRDGHSIMLCQGEQGQPGTWIWIGVEDIDPLFEQFTPGGCEDPTDADQPPVGVRDADRGPGWARASLRIGADAGPAVRSDVT